MPNREFTSRTRKTGLRDARLIIIAAEGTRTENRYFTELAASDDFRNPKVHIEVLERENDASSPHHIIRELDKFRTTYRLKYDDELWLAIDFDHWGIPTISSIATQCIQKGYKLALSNPCFEIWLLLHVASIDDYPPEIITEFYENRKTGNRTRIESELMTILGSYDKSNLRVSDYLPFVETAVIRARNSDAVPTDRWPNTLGTRIYLLIESIKSIRR